MEKKTVTNSPSKSPDSLDYAFHENATEGKVKPSLAPIGAADESVKPELHGKALRNKKKRDAKKAKKAGSRVEAQISSLSIHDDAGQLPQMAANESAGQAEKPDSGICANCRKETSSTCSGCAEAVQSDATLPKTWYCGSKCQTADHGAHKALCEKLQNRLQVYRAARTAQAAYYVYRERVFDVSIKRFQKKGKDIYIYEGPYKPTQVLAPFPHSLITEKVDKEAVLVYLTCGDAIANLQPFIGRLLEGCYTHIEEVDIRLKNHRRRTYFINALGQRDDKEYQHLVLRVTTKGGEQFAFDIASAQYGYHEPVQPWDEFVQSRVYAFRAVEPFGHYSGVWLKGQMQALTYTMNGAICRAHERASWVFDAAIMRWVDETKWSLPELMRRRERSFWDIMTLVIAEAGKVLQLWVAKAGGFI